MARYPFDRMKDAIANLIIPEDEIVLRRDDFFILYRLRASDGFPISIQSVIEYNDLFQTVHDALGSSEFSEMKAPKNPKKKWGMTSEEQARSEFVYDEIFDWVLDNYGVAARNKLNQAVKNKNTFFSDLESQAERRKAYEGYNEIELWEETACIAYGLCLPPPD